MSTIKKYNANVENLILSNLSSTPSSNVSKLYQLNNTLYFEDEPIGNLEIVNNKNLQILSRGIRKFKHTCSTSTNNPNKITLNSVNSNIVVGLEVSDSSETEEGARVISGTAIITEISQDKLTITINKDVNVTNPSVILIFRGINTEGDNPTHPSLSKNLLFNKFRIGLDSLLTERYETLRYDDSVGNLKFKGSSLTQTTSVEVPYHDTAMISCNIDGAASNNDMPGRLSFFTTPANPSQTLPNDPKERLRITSTGSVIIGYEPTYTDPNNSVTTSNYYNITEEAGNLSYQLDVNTRNQVAGIPGIYDETNPNLLHIQDGNIVVRTNKTQAQAKNFSLIFERSASEQDGNITDGPLSQNDTLGSVIFSGAAKTAHNADIGSFKEGAKIMSMVDSSRNKNANNVSSAMPSNLELWTSPRDSSSNDHKSLVKRMVIDSRGFVSISQSDTFFSNGEYQSLIDDKKNRPIAELSVAGKIAITSVHKDGFPADAPSLSDLSISSSGAGWLYLKADENNKIQLYNRNTSGEETCLSEIKELKDDLFFKDKDNSKNIVSIDCSNLTETTSINSTGTITIDSVNNKLILSSGTWSLGPTDLKTDDKILLSESINNNRIFTINEYTSNESGNNGAITVKETFNKEDTPKIIKINRISRKVNRFTGAFPTITFSASGKTITSSVAWDITLSQGDKIKILKSTSNNKIFTVNSFSNSGTFQVTIYETIIDETHNSGTILIERLDYKVQSFSDSSGDIIVSNLKPNNGDILYYSNNEWKKTTGSINGHVLQVSSNLPEFGYFNYSNSTESNNGILPVNSGGTGISSYTAGDIIYANSNSTPSLTALNIGSSNKILKSDGTKPLWGNIEFSDFSSNVLVTSSVSFKDNVTDTNIPSGLATKNYIDSVAAGLDIKDSCKVATTANLTASYNNGTSGVGATLTNSGTQSTLVIDNKSLSTNDRVLVKNQTDTKHNGIYVVTSIGSGSTNWILTRDIEADTGTKLTSGSYTYIEQGAVNSNKSFVFTHTEQPTIIGTHDLPVTIFSRTGIVIANTPLSINQGTLSLNTVGSDKGGTGQSSYSVGDILYYETGTTLNKLAIGNTGTVLSVSSENKPFWTTNPISNANELTDVSGNISLNLASFENFYITLGGNIVLSSPNTDGNRKGASGTIVINTNGNNRTLNWASNVGWFFENSIPVTLSSSNTVEIFNYFIAQDSTQSSSRKILVTKAGNFGHYV